MSSFSKQGNNKYKHTPDFIVICIRVYARYLYSLYRDKYDRIGLLEYVQTAKYCSVVSFRIQKKSDVFLFEMKNGNSVLSI
jgi:hypothetical protein